MLDFANYSERKASYKHQIYTDSHIAEGPEFCPPNLQRLVK